MPSDRQDKVGKDDGNGLVEMFEFFFDHGQRDEEISCKLYLSQRASVARKMWNTILGNPGYLTLVIGLLASWAAASNKVARAIWKVMGSSFVPPVEADMAGLLLSFLFAGVSVAALWSIALWRIRWQEKREEVLAESGFRQGVSSDRKQDCRMLRASYRSASKSSKIWVGVSIISQLVFLLFSGAYIGIYTWNVFLDERAFQINDFLVCPLILVATLINGFRVYSIVVGVDVGKMRGTIIISMVAMLLMAGVAGFSCFHFSLCCSWFYILLNNYVIILSLFSLLWFVTMGGYLLSHVWARRGVTQNVLSSNGAVDVEIRARREWARRDLLCVPIELALVVFTMALMQIMSWYVMAAIQGI